MTSPAGTQSLALEHDPARGDRPEDHLQVFCLLPTLNPYGGVISVVNALNVLIDRGHQVLLASLSRIGQDLLHPRTEPVFVPPGVSLGDMFSQTFDTLLATSWETVNPIVELAERVPGATAFYYVQDFEADFYADPATHALVLETYDLIPNRIVKTRYLQDRLEEHGWTATRIPPGMNLDVFYPRASGLDEQQPRVLAMARPGTPDDHRGYEVLRQVFGRLAERRPDVELVVFGAETLPGLSPRVKNLGRLPPESLPAVYSAATVFLDTSRNHGFGRTGVEAMACGTACVLSASGGVTEYAQHERNALVVPVGGVDASVTAVEHLLDDRELRVRLRSAGLETVQGLSDHRAAEAMLAHFRQVLAARAPSSAPPPLSVQPEPPCDFPTS